MQMREKGPSPLRQKQKQQDENPVVFVLVEAEGLDPRPRKYSKIFYKLSSPRQPAERAEIVPDGLTRFIGNAFQRAILRYDTGYPRAGVKDRCPALGAGAGIKRKPMPGLQLYCWQFLICDEFNEIIASSACYF